MPNDRPRASAPFLPPPTDLPAVIRVKVTHILELELAFPANTTEAAIKQFVTDRITTATTFGPCVRAARIEINPLAVVKT